MRIMSPPASRNLTAASADEKRSVTAPIWNESEMMMPLNPSSRRKVSPIITRERDAGRSSAATLGVLI